MPTYGWLLTQRYDTADVVASLRALRRVGLPYSDHDLAGAPASMRAQAEGIVGRLAGGGIQTTPDREIVAMIAYLQRLGRDGRAAIEAARPASQAAATTGPGVTP
jgi:cytochrome c oxidase cbb3-type subunit I/II